jgi:hypothetical protein
MGQQLQGVNFTNILHAAFKHTDYAQRSQKRKKIDSLTVFLFLGSVLAKAEHKMLMKSTPGSKLQ